MRITEDISSERTRHHSNDRPVVPGRCDHDTHGILMPAFFQDYFSEHDSGGRKEEIQPVFQCFYLRRYVLFLNMKVFQELCDRTAYVRIFIKDTADLTAGDRTGYILKRI